MSLFLYYDINSKISLNTSNLTYKRLSLINNRNIHNRKNIDCERIFFYNINIYQQFKFKFYDKFFEKS